MYIYIYIYKKIRSGRARGRTDEQAGRQTNGRAGRQAGRRTSKQVGRKYGGKITSIYRRRGILRCIFSRTCQ